MEEYRYLEDRFVEDKEAFPAVERKSETHCQNKSQDRSKGKLP